MELDKDPEIGTAQPTAPRANAGGAPADNFKKNIVVVAILALCWLFQFAALCHDELTVVEATVGVLSIKAEYKWQEGCNSLGCTKYSDIDAVSFADKCKSAGDAYLAFGILSFFSLTALLGLLVVKPEMPVPISALPVPLWLVALGVTWFMTMLSWSIWIGQCQTELEDASPSADTKPGASIALFVTVWLFELIVMVLGFMAHTGKVRLPAY